MYKYIYLERTVAQNPLQQYFRQPKIFISLPSQGVYNTPGSIDGDVGNLPVYGMTGMDEIIIKTPDALLTGESTVKVIQSCCPSIKDPWGLSALDLDLVLTAIRIATYGDELGMSATCPACQEENDYDVDLTRIIDHFSKCKYDPRVVVGSLVITTQPLNYQQSTSFNIRNFELQQRISQVDFIEDKEDKQKQINELWQQLAEIQRSIFAATIESVQTETALVTERGYIDEWLLNCDKEIINTIRSHIDKNRQVWTMPNYKVSCMECQHEFNLAIDLDQASFFATA